MPRTDKPSYQPKPSKSRKNKVKLWTRPLRWIRYLVLGFFAFSILSVLILRFVPPPLTPLMAIRYIEALLGPGDVELDKSWRPLEKISPRLAEAVIASEDQLFCEHWGFDWEAILSAFSINGQGKRKLGASTITQQTAKNLFLWPERSWSRKALEAYFTLLLEVLWSKERILEVYLNIIETGNGVYGAEAAAQKYFGISAKQLDRRQAALIASILPNPRVWSPVRPTPYLQRRQAWILRQMNFRGSLTEEFRAWKTAPQAARPVKAIRNTQPPKTATLPEMDMNEDTLPQAPILNPTESQTDNPYPAPSQSDSPRPMDPEPLEEIPEPQPIDSL